MLDQNTDRMWNVIGAVLIGAGIIFGMNTLMPEAFASVGGMFDDLVGIVNYDPDKEEIQDLINNGYIPVATADELDSIRNATLETYGKGTEWEDEYTGGLDKKYIQVADVDLSEYSGVGWNPIGTYVDYYNFSPFTGTYDGRNYEIRGLVVKGARNEYRGLFGYAKEATISNVRLIDNNVTGERYVGGLVGYADASTIENSYSTGSVTGTTNGKGYVAGGLVGYAKNNTTISNSYTTGPVVGEQTVGGLVGLANDSIIENSYTTGSVEGTGTGSRSGEQIGGLVGGAGSDIRISNSYATGSVESNGTLARNVGGLVGSFGGYNPSTISNSYATGEVTGKRYVGGLVGGSYNGSIDKSYATGSATGTGDTVGGLVGNANQDSTISNSYAIGSATGERYVGGLVGYIVNSITISNSYATGFVTVTYSGHVGFASPGGLVGYADNYRPNTIINSYWDKDTTDLERSAMKGEGKSEGKTTDEMKNQATYEDWDFDTVWMIDGNNYPKLR